MKRVSVDCCGRFGAFIDQVIQSEIDSIICKQNKLLSE